MTDAEKIEKLAKWMGWRRCNCMATPKFPDDFHWVEDIGVVKGVEKATDRWNPLTNIADAWMLLEKFDTVPIEESRWPEVETKISFSFWHLTASEAARAISEAVLEVIG